MKPSDGLLEALTLDEPHGVEGAPERVVAQAVDGDDPRVLQLPGDLGFHEEPGPAVGVVGVPVEDLLQRHLAVQLLVPRDEDGAQSALGVGAEDAEPLAAARGGADGVGGGAIGVGVAVGVEDEADECRVDLGVGDGGEAPSDRWLDPDGGEALLGVAVVLLEVLGGQRLDQPALLGVEMAEGPEVVGQGAGLVAGPGVEGGHELGLVDQPDLEGQQAEEEVAVGGDGGHGTGLPEGRHRRLALGPRCRGLRPGPADRLDYLMPDRTMQPRRGLPALPCVRQSRGLAWGADVPFHPGSARTNRRPECVRGRPSKMPGNGSLLEVHRPAYDSSCLGITDGLQRTVRLNQGRRRRLIIQTGCRVAHVGPTTPKSIRSEVTSVDQTNAPHMPIDDTRGGERAAAGRRWPEELFASGGRVAGPRPRFVLRLCIRKAGEACGEAAPTTALRIQDSADHAF